MLLKKRFLLLIAMGSLLYGEETIALYRGGEATRLPVDVGSSFDPGESEAFLRQLIPAGKLVFDVGANIGKNTALYLACGAKVVSFEPQPACVEALKKRFYGDPRVEIEPVGLGAKEGILEMFVCSDSPTISTFSQEYTRRGRFADRGCKWDEKIVAQVSTLDAMIRKYGVPHYCKMDVENFELEVLKGLSQQVPLLSFECNTDQFDTSKKCLDYLGELGYREFNFAFGERGYFVSPRWLSQEELIKKIEGLMESHDFSSIWGLWGDIYAKSNLFDLAVVQLSRGDEIR